MTDDCCMTPRPTGATAHTVACTAPPTRGHCGQAVQCDNLHPCACGAEVREAGA